MWVAGLGMEVYRIINGLSPDQIPSSENTDPQAPASRAGLFPMALVISGCIVIVVILLSKMTSWLVALIAGFLLALDPFYITHSQKIHVDAFLTSFMLVSAISWIVFLKTNQRFYLILSGVFGGLALLTKSPAWYLVPFVALVALIDIVTEGNWFSAGLQIKRLKRPELGRTIVSLGAWAVVAAITFFILWPAMWVEPARTISLIISGIQESTALPHNNAQFFAGRVAREDPGFLFYLATLAWQTTAITFLGALVALVFLIRKRKSGEDTRLWWYVLLFGVGFLLMMTLGAKKWGRYVLPTIAAIDILAAWGLVEVSRLISRTQRLSRVNWFPALFVTIALIIQAILVLHHYPYFGTRFNQLLGGSRVAQHILPFGLQGEGMDMAADYLNALPGADRLRVAMQKGDWLPFRSQFVGKKVWYDEDPHFVLFYINYVQREKNDKRMNEIWEKCQQELPTWSASFDGIPYIWLCSTYPRDPQEFAIAQQRSEKLGDHITLLGYDTSPTTVRAGETLTVNLYWQSDGQLRADDHVFIHLTNQEGELVVQHDGVPVQGERPTWSWLADEVLEDVYTLAIPETLEDGFYSLSTGMYDFGTLERLPVVNSSGERLLDDRIQLKDVQIDSLESG